MRFIYVLLTGQINAINICVATESSQQSPSLFLDLDSEIKKKSNLRKAILSSVSKMEQKGMLVQSGTNYQVTPWLVCLANTILGQTSVFNAYDIHRVLLIQKLNLGEGENGVLEVQAVLRTLVNTGLIDWVPTNSQVPSFQVDQGFVRLYKNNLPAWVFYISGQPHLLGSNGIYKFHPPSVQASSQQTQPTNTQPSIPQVVQVPQPVVPVQSISQGVPKMSSSSQNPNRVDKLNPQTSRRVFAMVKPK